ncbi:uncharacterized protein LOC133194391 [Saccostrea echinata]|uniref:uncharacterized protein LOC133194391 n=1 Tax=Saccostrea echinata TaxID=191078 RepID=UPI002A8017B8|nr:uncharacterized protein LOC133194391 [Saccostrea echinata]
MREVLRNGNPSRPPLTAFILHAMEKFSKQLKIRRCFQCNGNTEFYCNTCNYDLCLQCKERHVFDLHTKCHDVVIYREKFEYIPIQENCVKHSEKIYEIFCTSCEEPLCFRCIERIHELMDIRIAYKLKRQQHRGIIHNIRSEILYNNLFLMTGIKADIKTCYTQISSLKSKVLRKAQRLKDVIDTVVCDVKIRCTRYSMNKLPEQNRKISRYLASIENYVHISEQSANRAVKFLLYQKKALFSKIEGISSRAQHNLSFSTEKSNTEDMIKLISEIKILERGRRQVRNEDLLNLTSASVLHRSVTVPGVNGVTHISCVTPNLVWINDYHKLILTNTAGDTLHYMADIWSYTWSNGAHSVNIAGDLIYIDRGGNIKRLSKDSSTSKTLIEKTNSWQPQCVYCSQSNGDILVMMWNTDKSKGKGMLTRYNYKGQPIQTIGHKKSGQKLYSCPIYITENRNGDVIVSDFIDYHQGAVVVTGRGGKYLFSYTGPPTGSGLRPHGICTDVLLNIMDFTGIPIETDCVPS